jgi:hypothetical protein
MRAANVDDQYFIAWRHCPLRFDQSNSVTSPSTAVKDNIGHQCVRFTLRISPGFIFELGV